MLRWKTFWLTDKDHCFIGTNKISWCGGVHIDDEYIKDPFHVNIKMPRNGRACPHCLGAILDKPAKWQKRNHIEK